MEVLVAAGGTRDGPVVHLRGIIIIVVVVISVFSECVRTRVYVYIINIVMIIYQSLCHVSRLQD